MAGEHEKGGQMEETSDASKSCPLCPFESSQEWVLWEHTNAHFYSEDQQEEMKSKELKKSAASLSEDKKNGKGYEGIKSNVSFLDVDESDAIPFKLPSKKVSLQLEGKAKKLSAKIEREEFSGQEDDDNSDGGMDAEESDLDDNYVTKRSKNKMLKGTIASRSEEMNLKSLKKRMDSVKTACDKRKEAKETIKNNIPEKKVKMDPLEQSIVDLVSVVKDKVNQKNEPQYLPQGYPQYVPYGYPYGIMGAPSPSTQSSGIFPTNMFHPPMQHMRSPPMFPAQTNNSQLSQKGQDLASPAPRSVSGEAGQSSSKITPAMAHHSQNDTGPPSSVDGETGRAPGTSHTSVSSETERSSSPVPGARRDFVIDQAGHPSHGGLPSARGSPDYAPPQVSTPPVTSHGMNPFMYPWFYPPMQWSSQVGPIAGQSSMGEGSSQMSPEKNGQQTGHQPPRS